MVVAERACLGRAAAGARDRVPVVGNDFAGGAGARIAEDDGEAGELGEVDGVGRIACGLEGDGGNGEICEVVAKTVIGGFGEVCGEGGVCGSILLDGLHGDMLSEKAN